MTCEVSIENGRIVISDPARSLTGRHRSQMAFWGLDYDPATTSYAGAEHPQLLDKVIRYFGRFHVPLDLAQSARQVYEQHVKAREVLEHAMRYGALFKSASTTAPEYKGFVDYVKGLPRTLKHHQLKSAIHMLAVGNGANFSVPGAGKTAVVLAAFGWLKSQGQLTSLFIVGPPSCFAPWQMEFEAVLGRKPSVEIVAGGDVAERQRKYYATLGTIADLYLTTFQTLQRDVERAKHLLGHKEVRFLLVIDEAHYIKQSQGSWAEAVLALAPFAARRCVLTGTPFPHSYRDAFNYFDVLWPEQSPLSRDDRVRITHEIQRKNDAAAAAILTSSIGPFFYRVRKRELSLAAQDFKPPTLIAMKPHERRLYDAIVSKIRDVAIGDDYQEFELLTRLKRGRMMRLRQCLSHPKLLATAVSEYNEDLIGKDFTLRNTIKHYDELEVPAKLEYAANLVNALRSQGQRVLVWSNFVETLKVLKDTFTLLGHRTELIYGGTPTEDASYADERTREDIIRGFVANEGSVDVLVANPAACAESVSLHRNCSHAVYYDLSYNCAQYLQSLDRIHRVGGSENKVSHYYFLQCADTLDQDILSNLLRKAENMSAVVDQECPVYSLDMFSDEDELSAYERLFRQRD